MDAEKTTFLQKMAAQKRYLLSRQMVNMPIEALRRRLREMPDTKPFKHALQQEGKVSIIAEIKRASPSAGTIREDFTVRNIAKEYALGGAAAISVLTEEDHFRGHRAHLMEARGAVDLPLLRKDFIIDAYQVYESRVFGADAILLIAALLEQAKLVEFIRLAGQLGMASLVEVHNEEELARALESPAEIIGVNNRNLNTLEVDPETAARLCPKIPKDRIVVAESGIKSPAELSKLKKIGVHAALIGETLMRRTDIGAALKEFVQAS